MSRNNHLDLARQLAGSLARRADEADKTGALPPEDVAELRQSGYLGLSVPQAFGGWGLSLHDCVAAQMILAQGSPSTAMVAGMQLHLFGSQRESRSWCEAKYEQFCRAAATGSLFNSLASEPELGSPSRGGLPGTTAVEKDGGYLVRGRKTWSTGGQHLTHLLVRVALKDEPAVILILQDTPGLSWVKTWSDSLSLRASDSHDALFTDVWVPADHLVEQGAGKKSPNVWFPMIMSSIYLGAALAARQAVIQFALERVPTALGKPIATLPKIQRQIGEMDIALQAARAFLLTVAGEWSGNEGDAERFMARIAAAKTFVTETANRVTEQALQIAGGQSITRALPLERYFRDVRAGSMQPPSGDTALEMVGRAAIESEQ
ncbi:MAG: acyl-CoA/acyl-ACP dehydrogenase [Anaerolineae bacterium]|nr:acyl-CoA/acyl-ACP dehydrogenase [Anaerolineae bacterium]